MKLTKGIILFALAAFAFASCKESTDDETPAAKTSNADKFNDLFND